MNTHHIDSVVTLLHPQPAPRRRAFNIGLHIPGQKRHPITLCDAEPAPTVLRELIESPEFSDTANNIPFALGVQEDGSFLIPDLHALPHLLVAGKNEGEVGAALRTVLLSLLLRQRDEKVRIECLNCSSGDANLAEYVRILQERAHEATDRLRYFAMAGAGSMDAFNSRRPETLRSPEAEKFLPGSMMRHVIVLHNLGALLQTESEKTLDAMTRLCKATSHSQVSPRDAGIHLIITCDAPTKENLPDEWLKLIPARMVFRTPSTKRLLPGLPADGKRLKLGVFRFRAHKDAEHLTSTLPISTDEELNAVLQYRMSHGG